MRKALSLLCALLLVTAQVAAQNTVSSSILEQALAQQGQGGAIGGGGDESGDDRVGTNDPIPSSSGGGGGGWKVVAWLFVATGGVLAFGEYDETSSVSENEARTVGWILMAGFGSLAVFGDRQRSVPIPGTGLGFQPKRGGGAVTKGIGW